MVASAAPKEVAPGVTEIQNPKGGVDLQFNVNGKSQTNHYMAAMGQGENRVYTNAKGDMDMIAIKNGQATINSSVASLDPQKQQVALLVDGPGAPALAQQTSHDGRADVNSYATPSGQPAAAKPGAQPAHVKPHGARIAHRGGHHRGTGMAAMKAHHPAQLAQAGKPHARVHVAQAHSHPPQQSQPSSGAILVQQQRAKQTAQDATNRVTPKFGPSPTGMV